MERSYGCKTTGILSGNRGCRYDQRCGACSSHDTATAELSGKDARRRTSGAAFLRGTKKITLTEAGKTLYDRAGSLLTMADITKREVIKASQAATIHIGFTPSTVSMMSDYLIRFSTSHPDIRFDIHEGSTFTLREQLENGVVDITTLRTPIVLKGCESRTLMQEKLLAMAAAGNPVLEKTKMGSRSRNCQSRN